MVLNRESCASVQIGVYLLQSVQTGLISLVPHKVQDRFGVGVQNLDVKFNLTWKNMLKSIWNLVNEGGKLELTFKKKNKKKRKETSRNAINNGTSDIYLLEILLMPVLSYG